MSQEYAQHTVAEWIGKTIVFPEDVLKTSVEESPLDSVKNKYPYTILLFTDSAGCTTCKLRLKHWNILIKETDSLLPNMVDFKFYFHPKNIKELKFLFNLPVGGIKLVHI